MLADFGMIHWATSDADFQVLINICQQDSTCQQASSTYAMYVCWKDAGEEGANWPDFLNRCKDRVDEWLNEKGLQVEQQVCLPSACPHTYNFISNLISSADRAGTKRDEANRRAPGIIGWLGGLSKSDKCLPWRSV